MDARVTDPMPSPTEFNSRQDASERPSSWLETVGVLAFAIAVLAAATWAGNLAAVTLDWYVGIDTPQARPGGALQAFTAVRLSVFLAAFQLATIALTAAAARIFRGRRVAFLALSAPVGGLRACLGYCAILIAGAALYAGAVILQNRNALLGDIMLLSDMMHTDAWLMIVLAAVVGAPIAEEFLFRGMLYGVLRTSPLGMTMAAVITAVLWASVHAQYSLYGVFGIALIGLYLAWVREKTGSLVAPIVCHAVYNGCVLAVMLLMPERYMQMS